MSILGATVCSVATWGVHAGQVTFLGPGVWLWKVLALPCSVDPNDQKKTACYDIDVEVEDPLKGQMSSFLLSTANQQEITALDNKVPWGDKWVGRGGVGRRALLQIFGAGGTRVRWAGRSLWNRTDLVAGGGRLRLPAIFQKGNHVNLFHCL